MTLRRSPCLDRRQLLKASTAFAVSACSGLARAGDRPPVTDPKAISGDRVEPNWEERLSITVGPRKADLVGSTEKVIQAAADYVARLGGGTVQVLPGTYRLRNSVHLPSKIRILGTGDESVLVKEPSHRTTLSANSDWYDQEITLADARDFQIGDGVCLQARNPHNQGSIVLKRTLVARSGNRFKLDRPLRDNLWLAGKPTASGLFPLLTGENVSDIAVENIALDGNRKNNEHLDGNYGGCIWFQDCSRIAIRGVTARNNNGDGISWQICHDVVVENCHSHDNADLGLHPGSGSQRPVIVGNKVRKNNIGIFFCWGVRHGLAEKNVIEDSGSFGISIGHRDTDNFIRDNDVLRSGKVGVLFRGEDRPFAGHRNLVEKNRIRDSGPDDGVGVDIQGETESVTLAGNEIRETRQPMKRIGVRIGAKTRDVRLTGNHIEGYPVPVVDLRKSQAAG